MRRLVFLLLAMAPSVALAQSSTFPTPIDSIPRVPGTANMFLNSQGQAVPVTSSNPLPVTGSGGGSVTQGTTPWEVGGVYNSSLPTVTNGSQAPLQLDASGRLIVTIGGTSTVVLGAGSATIGAVTQSGTWNVAVTSLPSLAAGTNSIGAVTEGGPWNVGISGTLPAFTATPTFNVGTAPLLAVAQQPQSGSAYGIALTQTAALATAFNAKASAGNLYTWEVTSTVPGYVLLFNATSAPAAGAVTPLRCAQMNNAGTITSSSAGEPPTYFSTGIEIVFSSTGCFTYTASTTAFISAKVQ